MQGSSTRLALAAAAALFAAVGPAAASEWEGFSLGIGGGYGMADDRFGLGDGTGSHATIDGLSATGGFFTLGVGYDHVLLNTLLVGAFLDYDFADLQGSVRASDPLSDSSSSLRFRIDDQLSIGARLGYLISPTTLFYSAGGYAHVETSDLKATERFEGASSSAGIASFGGFDGYFIASGLEALISDGFSIKAEYRYTSLETENAGLFPGSELADAGKVSIRPHIQTMRLSLNYRFGDGKTEEVDDSIPPITSSWTGPYFGVGGGYGAITNRATFDTLLGSGSSTIDGFASDGGFVFVSLGYDYQLNKKFVAGAFVDADHSNFEQQNKLTLSDGETAFGIGTKSEFKNILMAGARLGYLITPDTLVFASGGYANAGLRATPITETLSVDGSTVDSESTTLFGGKRFSGGFIGGGIETKIWDTVSLKAEYRYIDLGSESISLLPGELPEINEIVSTKFDPDVQMGRLSINYRFGGGAEAPAAPLK